MTSKKKTQKQHIKELYRRSDFSFTAIVLLLIVICVLLAVYTIPNRDSITALEYRESEFFGDGRVFAITRWVENNLIGAEWVCEDKTVQKTIDVEGYCQWRFPCHSKEDCESHANDFVYETPEYWLQKYEDCLRLDKDNDGFTVVNETIEVCTLQKEKMK